MQCELSTELLGLHLALEHTFLLAPPLGDGEGYVGLYPAMEILSAPISSRAEMQLLAGCRKLHVVILITA